MADAAEWEQKSDWHWAGPGGWTICKVWIGGGYKFELWRPGADCAEDTRASLKAAQKRHAEIAG